MHHACQVGYIGAFPVDKRFIEAWIILTVAQSFVFLAVIIGRLGVTAGTELEDDGPGVLTDRLVSLDCAFWPRTTK